MLLWEKSSKIHLKQREFTLSLGKKKKRTKRGIKSHNMSGQSPHAEKRFFFPLMVNPGPVLSVWPSQCHLGAKST